MIMRLVSSQRTAARQCVPAVTRAFAPPLAAQGTRMTALHVGYMDTDMTRRPDVPKAGLSGGVPALHPQFA